VIGAGAAPNDRPGDDAAPLPGTAEAGGPAGEVALGAEICGIDTDVAGLCSGVRVPGVAGVPR
jgi:hypothetical protein